jgi:hypothetical protein
VRAPLPKTSPRPVAGCLVSGRPGSWSHCFPRSRRSACAAYALTWGVWAIGDKREEVARFWGCEPCSCAYCPRLASLITGGRGTAIPQIPNRRRSFTPRFHPPICRGTQVNYGTTQWKAGSFGVCTSKRCKPCMSRRISLEYPVRLSTCRLSVTRHRPPLGTGRPTCLCPSFNAHEHASFL